MQWLHNTLIGNITRLLKGQNPLFSLDVPPVVDYDDRKDSRCIKYNVGWENVMLKTDRVCVRAANRGVRIRCQRMDSKTILVEGTEEGLKFLGKLLIAQAEDQISCKKHISPNGPGSALFTRTSDAGLYMHRIPCEYGPVNIKKRKKAPNKSLKRGAAKSRRAP